MNPYDILGVPVSASIEDIRQRYKSLAQTYHPDKGGDEEHFKEIKLAYEILSDPDKRKQYDLTGKISDDLGIRNEVLTQLSQMFSRLFPTMNPETDDLVLMMKVETRRMKASVENDIQEANKTIDKLTKVLGRIKLKSEGENLIGNFAKTRLKEVENDLITFSNRLKVCDTMLEILENYHYNLEEWMLFINNQPSQPETPAETPAT